MVEYQPISTTIPLFSIIIAVYNDWIALDPCLRSLAQQNHEPSFEVIVVDDGCSEAAPEVIRQWARCLSLAIVRQSPAGISVRQKSWDSDFQRLGTALRGRRLPIPNKLSRNPRIHYHRFTTA